jgi:hypothetical protein
MDAGRIAPGYAQAYTAIKNALVGYEGNLLTQELVDGIPYASSVLTIGKGPEGLIILESINGINSTWVSADGVYLTIQNGKIVQTAGLPNNLTDFIHPFKSNFLQNITPDLYLYYYSYDKPFLSDLRVEARLEKRGKEVVRVFKKDMELILIEESIENQYIGWEATNKYWVDDTNFVWKSEQFISPKLPKFVLEVTKKPSS